MMERMLKRGEVNQNIREEGRPHRLAKHKRQLDLEIPQIENKPGKTHLQSDRLPRQLLEQQPETPYNYAKDPDQAPTTYNYMPRYLFCQQGQEYDQPKGQQNYSFHHPITWTRIVNLNRLSYNQVQLLPSKKYSFPKSKNNLVNEIKPSPDSYQVLPPDRAHIITFSKSKRNSLVDSTKTPQPGPGEYEGSCKKFPSKELSFTKSKKFVEDEQQYQSKEKIPGPGSYEISKKRHNLQTYKFTQALKTLSSKQITPGPGSYQGQKSMLNHNGGIISNQKRQFIYDDKNPGPGSYKQVAVESIKKRQPTVKFYKGEQRVKRFYTDIGPGAYRDVDLNRKIPGGFISRSKKISDFENTTPGPLSYTPNYDEVLSRSTNIVIGKDQGQKRIKNSTPGPGYYSTEMRSISMGGKLSRNNKTEIRLKRQNNRVNNTTMGHQ